MSSNYRSVIDDYKAILKEDGPISKEALLKMVKLDGEIPDMLKNENGYNNIVEKILSPSINELKEKRRIAMYERGFDLTRIAESEGRSAITIYQWFKLRGIDAYARG